MCGDSEKTDEQLTLLKKRLFAIEEEKKKILLEIESLNREKILKEIKAGKQLGSPASIKVPVSPQEKIDLFLALFRCRQNVFPKLWQNLKKGTKGYSPQCRNDFKPNICEKPKIKCSVCPHQAFDALDETAVRAHLEGKITIVNLCYSGR